MSSRSKEYRRLITSKRWKELRAVKMARNPLCEDCLLDDRATLATEVHHVIPVEHGRSMAEMERLAFDYTNLRSLCEKCHQKTHERMNSKGREAAKASSERETKRFISKYLD